MRRRVPASCSLSQPPSTRAGSSSRVTTRWLASSVRPVRTFAQALTDPYEASSTPLDPPLSSLDPRLEHRRSLTSPRHLKPGLRLGCISPCPCSDATLCHPDSITSDEEPALLCAFTGAIDPDLANVVVSTLHSAGRATVWFGVLMLPPSRAWLGWCAGSSRPCPQGSGVLEGGTMRRRRPGPRPDNLGIPLPVQSDHEG